MGYVINKTNGSILVEVPDGTVDQTSTSLTLVGRNYNRYGEFINENYVKLLENFSNSTAPDYPLIGQLWFDTTTSTLKVYDGSSFKSPNNATVASSAPQMSAGEFWIDTLYKRLYFNDGATNILAGPGPLGLSLDTTGLSNNDIAIILASLYPTNELANGVICRVHCVDLTTGTRVRTNKIFTIVGGVWTFTS